MGQNHCTIIRICSTSAIAGFVLAATPVAAQFVAGVPPASSPTAPTPQETRKAVAAGNAYRRLLASALTWRSPLAQDCGPIQARIAGYVDEIPPADPAAAQGDANMNFELQQRDEESDMTKTALINRDIHLAIEHDCLVLPK